MIVDRGIEAERESGGMLIISTINYCNPRGTSKCILSLHHACTEIPHCFLVADHSPQSELELIKVELPPQIASLVTFRHSADNPGFAAGHNRNFESVSWGPTDIFLVVNNDVTVRDVHLLEQMISYCRPKTLLGCVITKSGSGEVWFAGGRISRITGDIKLRRSWPQTAASETEVLCGCCIMINAQDFADLNGFDERFFLYAEDLDLAIRAAKKQYRLLIVNRGLDHEVGSGWRGSYSSLYLYENTKNRLICLKRHHMGLPFVRDVHFVTKYLLFRAVQLLLFSRAPRDQMKAVVQAFVDGFKARKAA